MAEPMLDIRELACGYGNQPVLRGVDMSVAAGEMVGIIGPNGCGKTTLVRAATGILPLSAGSVRINGRDVGAMSPREVARIVAFVAQDREVGFSFDVEEIVLMGRTPHMRRFGWETHRDAEVARSAMRMCDISHLAERNINELSGGERQRAFIAMALAQEPGLLFLDEPTSHLDINHQLGILDIVRDLNRRDGLTVVMISHDLNLASEYCDRLYLLCDGKVFAKGPPEEVLVEDTILATYRARVHMDKSPVTGRPLVILVPGARAAEASRERERP